MPGSPLDPRPRAPTTCCGRGATLCTRAEDVLEALGPIADAVRTGVHFGHRLREASNAQGRLLFDEAGVDGSDTDDLFGEMAADLPELDDQSRLLDLLGTAPVAIDDLVRLSGLDAARVRIILMDLELDGALERHAGALVSRAAPALIVPGGRRRVARYQLSVELQGPPRDACALCCLHTPIEAEQPRSRRNAGGATDGCLESCLPLCVLDWPDWVP